MIQGLYHELAAKSAKRDAGNRRLEDPEISANERHSLEWTAGDLAREIDRLADHVAENTSMAGFIQALIITIQKSEHTVRHRSLLLTHLEQAQDRLRRELGDKPE